VAGEIDRCVGAMWGHETGPVALGFLASLLAGLFTGVGALPVLFGRKVSQRTNDLLLGLAAGVMLAASFFSLIVPGMDIARASHERVTHAFGQLFMRMTQINAMAAGGGTLWP